MRDIETIIREVEIWRGASHISFEPLNGGLVNCTYKVKVDDLFYVVRINGAQNSFLKLKREDEAAVIHKASELGIAPKVLMTENQAEYLITEYKPGHIITGEEIHHPDLIKRVAETLVKVHAIEGINRECSPFDLIDNYLAGAKTLQVGFPEGLPEILRKVENIHSRWLKNSKYTRRYCHNDYYTLNIIHDNEALWVIDWELSGMGDLFFDLATISFSNAFSEEEDQLLLQSYFGSVDDSHKSLLLDMKFMNMLREVSWSLLHSGMEVKKVNHDFNYYENALRFVERLKNGYVTAF